MSAAIGMMQRAVEDVAAEDRRRARRSSWPRRREVDAVGELRHRRPDSDEDDADDERVETPSSGADPLAPETISAPGDDQQPSPTSPSRIERRVVRSPSTSCGRAPLAPRDHHAHDCEPDAEDGDEEHARRPCRRSRRAASATVTSGTTSAAAMSRRDRRHLRPSRSPTISSRPRTSPMFTTLLPSASPSASCSRPSSPS